MVSVSRPTDEISDSLEQYLNATLYPPWMRRLVGSMKYSNVKIKIDFTTDICQIFADILMNIFVFR